MAEITRTVIKSTQIHSVGYDPDNKTLIVEFRDPRGEPDPNWLYEYDGVPKVIYDDLIDPEYPLSKGKMFTHLVKRVYDFRKVKKEA